MAAYTKAWVIRWEEGRFGIAYERDDGFEGFLQVGRSGHRDLPVLMRLLSPSDQRKVEENLSNVIPFHRSKV